MVDAGFRAVLFGTYEWNKPSDNQMCSLLSRAENWEQVHITITWRYKSKLQPTCLRKWCFVEVPTTSPFPVHDPICYTMLSVKELIEANKSFERLLYLNKQIPTPIVTQASSVLIKLVTDRIERIEPKQKAITVLMKSFSNLASTQVAIARAQFNPVSQQRNLQTMVDTRIRSQTNDAALNKFLLERAVMVQRVGMVPQRSNALLIKRQQEFYQRRAARRDPRNSTRNAAIKIARNAARNAAQTRQDKRYPPNVPPVTRPVVLKTEEQIILPPTINVVAKAAFTKPVLVRGLKRQRVGEEVYIPPAKRRKLGT